MLFTIVHLALLAAAGQGSPLPHAYAPVLEAVSVTSDLETRQPMGPDAAAVAGAVVGSPVEVAVAQAGEPRNELTKRTPSTSEVGEDLRDELEALQKRQAGPGTGVTILGSAAGAAASAVITMAIENTREFIKNLRDWTPVREAFTKQTAENMWSRNPDPRKYPAVACYNKGYHLTRPGGEDGPVKARLSLGALHTDYDCFYMEGNNAFHTHSEGGFINLAYKFDQNRCSFDQKTGDLTCK